MIFKTVVDNTMLTQCSCLFRKNETCKFHVVLYVRTGYCCHCVHDIMLVVSLDTVKQVLRNCSESRFVELEELLCNTYGCSVVYAFQMYGTLSEA